MAKFNDLSEEESRVIEQKGTEPPHSGEYDQHFVAGSYVCRRCNAPLYESKTKFESGCGWPSFDENIEGAVHRYPDPDGMRTEIVCANCGGHLGHVFSGESHTSTNTRHCVNSVSLKFVPEEKLSTQYASAVFASGCFWGTDFWFFKLDGVIATTAGYAGGDVENPTYQQVCSGTTGHAESLQVVYDPALVTYDELVKLFFETHDPTQVDGQGPDIGTQYRSVIFYNSDEEKQIAQKYKSILEKKGLTIATSIEPLKVFYAEQDPNHQKYYFKRESLPYCHIYEKKFD